jgi:hypothetical protein
LETLSGLDTLFHLGHKRSNLILGSLRIDNGKRVRPGTVMLMVDVLRIFREERNRMWRYLGMVTSSGLDTFRGWSLESFGTGVNTIEDTDTLDQFMNSLRFSRIAKKLEAHGFRKTLDKNAALSSNIRALVLG